MSKVAVAIEIVGGLVCISGMLLCGGIGQLGGRQFTGPIADYLADHMAQAIVFGIASIIGGLAIFKIGVLIYRLTNLPPRDP
jgi:hypothetical protein